MIDQTPICTFNKINLDNLVHIGVFYRYGRTIEKGRNMTDFREPAERIRDIATKHVNRYESNIRYMHVSSYTHELYEHLAQKLEAYEDALNVLGYHLHTCFTHDPRHDEIHVREIYLTRYGSEERID